MLTTNSEKHHLLETPRDQCIVEVIATKPFITAGEQHVELFPLNPLANDTNIKSSSSQICHENMLGCWIIHLSLILLECTQFFSRGGKRIRFESLV